MSTSNIHQKSYHHGDLRNTLITTALEMLVEEGTAALSLRGLAKRAGVSHNAPYQHFADKEALMAAIAEQGFRILITYIDASQDGLAGRDSQMRLVAAGQSYVRFAIEHPGHLQVMFGPLASSQYPTLAQAAFMALDRLIAIAAQGQASGEIRVDAREAAMTIWMLVHGLSSTYIAQKLPDAMLQERSPLALAEIYIRLACEGLVHHGNSPAHPFQPPANE
jgi:AcrR family transcriptional regulator